MTEKEVEQEEVVDVEQQEEEQKSSLISGQELKDKLAGFFTSSSSKPKANLPSTTSTPTTAAAPQEQPTPPQRRTPSGRRAGRELACVGWADGFMPRGRSEISEACRQAFTATCHLLLECTTFPVYLSEEETHELHTKMFVDPGERRMMSP